MAQWLVNLTSWLQRGQRAHTRVRASLYVSSHQRLCNEWEAWGKQKLSGETSDSALYISASAHCDVPLTN